MEESTVSSYTVLPASSSILIEISPKNLEKVISIPSEYWKAEIGGKEVRERVLLSGNLPAKLI